ncbi:hypothetical protein IWW55_007474 [Coemansia sp. RSA 2706]|nr:hypothetical protein IWW55_007474 [Coemansia sp. RSA 2706]
MPAVRSGVPNSVAAANTSAGMLALPTNTHDKAKEKTAARRESESVMDEALEDELAKELEGMLDDDSDDGRSRRNSKSLEKRVNSEDQLNAELVESLDEALLDANGSDEDEFEEVDESEVLAARRESSRLTNDKSDRRSTADFDDEDEMIFEEVDPPAELGPVESIEEDSDQFEEVDGSRVNSMADDSLFSGSYTASPMSYIDQPSSSHQQTKKPSSLDTVDDEFEDLDLDLARSLDSS